MYIMWRINELGQVMGSKGIAGFEDNDGQQLTFSNLEKAEKYGQCYVHRYPQLACQIYSKDKPQLLIKTISNSVFDEHQALQLKELNASCNDKKHLGFYLMLCFWVVLVLTLFTFSFLLFNAGLGYFTSLGILLAATVFVILAYLIFLNGKPKKRPFSMPK